MIQNLSLTYSKFKAFTTHILDQHGQMQLTTTGYLETVRGICLFYT